MPTVDMSSTNLESEVSLSPPSSASSISPPATAISTSISNPSTISINVRRSIDSPTTGICTPPQASSPASGLIRSSSPSSTVSSLPSIFIKSTIATTSTPLTSPTGSSFNHSPWSRGKSQDSPTLTIPTPQAQASPPATSPSPRLVISPSRPSLSLTPSNDPPRPATGVITIVPQREPSPSPYQSYGGTPSQPSSRPATSFTLPACPPTATCGICDIPSSATWYCLDCCMYLCQADNRQIHRPQKMRNHTRIAAEEYQQQEQQQAEDFAMTIPDERIPVCAPSLRISVDADPTDSPVRSSTSTPVANPSLGARIQKHLRTSSFRPLQTTAPPPEPVFDLTQSTTCDQCGERESAVYCYDCQSAFCDSQSDFQFALSCNRRIHKPQSKRHHRQVVIAIYRTQLLEFQQAEAANALIVPNGHARQPSTAPSPAIVTPEMLFQAQATMQAPTTPRPRSRSSPAAMTRALSRGVHTATPVSTNSSYSSNGPITAPTATIVTEQGGIAEMLTIGDDAEGEEEEEEEEEEEAVAPPVIMSRMSRIQTYNPPSRNNIRNPYQGLEKASPPATASASRPTTSQRAPSPQVVIVRAVTTANAPHAAPPTMTSPRSLSVDDVMPPTRPRATSDPPLPPSSSRPAMPTRAAPSRPSQAPAPTADVPTSQLISAFNNSVVKKDHQRVVSFDLFTQRVKEEAQQQSQQSSPSPVPVTQGRSSNSVIVVGSKDQKQVPRLYIPSPPISPPVVTPMSPTTSSSPFNTSSSIIPTSPSSPHNESPSTSSPIHRRHKKASSISRPPLVVRQRSRLPIASSIRPLDDTEKHDDDDEFDYDDQSDEYEDEHVEMEVKRPTSNPLEINNVDDSDDEDPRVTVEKTIQMVEATTRRVEVKAKRNDSLLQLMDASSD